MLLALALVAEHCVVLIKMLNLEVVFEEGGDELGLFLVVGEWKDVVQDLLLSVGSALASVTTDLTDDPIEEQALELR